MSRLFAAFAGSDGKTALIAVSAAGGVVVFLGLSIASFVRVHTAFDGTAFAAGWGLTLGASAAAIAGHAWGAAKADAIPSAPDATPSPAPGVGS